MEVVRWVAILLLISFGSYSIYCNLKESFFQSAKTMWRLHFGRQAIIDLYLGLILFMFFVYLIEDSILTTGLWFLAAIPFVNIVSLIYVIVHFDRIIALMS